MFKIMERKWLFGVFVILSLGALAGCATASRNTEADLDALNSKISSLQGQLSEKDAEIARLQNQMRDGETARIQAEAEKRIMGQKLDSLTAELVAKAHEAKTHKKEIALPSDLK